MKLQDQKVQFLNGEFTPMEAKDLITKIIDEQINQYKLQHLSRWEHDHNTDVVSFKEKITRLNDLKQELVQVTNSARLEGCNLDMSGMLVMNMKK